MEFIWRRSSVFIGKGSVDIAATIRDKLQSRMQRRNSLRKFITRDSLEDIWSVECLEDFVRQYKPFTTSDISIIRESYLQTLSILVDISWDRWQDFKTIFLERTGRSDQNIPTYSLQTLEDETFLGVSWAGTFLDTRYIYCPVDIVEGENLKYSEGWRLPFLDCDPEERGHSPDTEYDKPTLVTKECVATRHLYLRDRAPSSGNKILACKRFRNRDDFEHEKENLLKLNIRLAMDERNDRIMPLFASISVGHEFNLLFEWADSDLKCFLEQRSGSYRLCDLMEEACNLAGALAFLHGGPNSPQLVCHRDLKPDNILVFKEDGMRVGKWKISDFGISVLSVPAARSSLNGTFSYMLRRTVPGTYQSPEVFYGKHFGRRSDVWSLGCILVRILAFGMDGNVLKNLDDGRSGVTFDGKPYGYDCFHCKEPPILNPHIERWVKELPSNPNVRFPKEACHLLRRLLLKALEVDKEARLTAKEVKDKLEHIHRILLPVEDLPLPEVPLYASHLLASIDENNIDNLKSQLRYDVDVEAPIKSAGGKEERLLVHAIRKRDSKAVDSLLSLRPRLDKESLDSEGNTPLVRAIKTGHEGIFKLLIQAGVDIDARSKAGMTPLMQATLDGHIGMVRSLLDNGANCLARCDYGHTCVHYIVWASNNGAELIKEFQRRGNYLNLTGGESEESPLIALIKSHPGNPGWKSKFAAFLTEGVDINLADVHNRTPLYHALDKDLEEVANTLLGKDAKLYPNCLELRWKKPWMKDLLRRHGYKVPAIMSFDRSNEVSRNGFASAYGRFYTSRASIERVDGPSLRRMILPKQLGKHHDFVRGQLQHYGVPFEEHKLIGNGTVLLKKAVQAGKCDAVPAHLLELQV
ncbi:kinase-like domain-containing protein [Aspergillus recurvatus]